MKVHHSYQIILALALIAMAGQANAALTGGPDIILAPASVEDDAPGAENTNQQAFNEQQGVLLAAAVDVDGGSIPAGTWVNSHMIFLNTASGSASDLDKVWTFDGPVLGVMSDRGGALEAASSSILGASGTTYPGAFGLRGLEGNGNDGYVVAGSQITVSMNVAEPGDWIRVVTAVREVEVDIKPTSCPNPLNVKSKGVLPVAILGAADFDITTLDPATIQLEGVAPLRWDWEDVATPFDGDKDDCDDCTEEGPDGFLDLTLKFNKQEIIAALGDIKDGDCLTLTLQGQQNGTPIVGEDVVVILKKGKGKN